MIITPLTAEAVMTPTFTFSVQLVAMMYLYINLTEAAAALHYTLFSSVFPYSG